jgi:hypothetical protein
MIKYEFALALYPANKLAAKSLASVSRGILGISNEPIRQKSFSPY